MTDRAVKLFVGDHTLGYGSYVTKWLSNAEKLPYELVNRSNQTAVGHPLNRDNFKQLFYVYEGYFPPAYAESFFHCEDPEIDTQDKAIEDAINVLNKQNVNSIKGTYNNQNLIYYQIVVSKKEIDLTRIRPIEKLVIKNGKVLTVQESPKFLGTYIKEKGLIKLNFKSRKSKKHSRNKLKKRHVSKSKTKKRSRTLKSRQR